MRRVDELVSTKEGHNEEEGRRIGYDFFRVGVVPPKDAPATVLQGFDEARHRKASRSAQCGEWDRKLVRLRLSAWKRNRIVDASVTSEYLQTIFQVAHCPVTLVNLTRPTNEGKKETDSTVDRVFNQGAYAKGNLAVLSRRANEAKANRLPEEIYEVADTGEALDGLEAWEWQRMASLCSMATPPGYAQSIRPLLVWPPPGLLISNGYSQAMMGVSLYAAGKIPAQRWAQTRQRLKGKRAKAQLDLVCTALQASVLHQVQGGEQVSLERANREVRMLEGAWRGELVWKLTADLLRMLSGDEVRVLGAVFRGYDRANTKELSDRDMEGWSVGTRGYEKG